MYSILILEHAGFIGTEIVHAADFCQDGIDQTDAINDKGTVRMVGYTDVQLEDGEGSGDLDWSTNAGRRVGFRRNYLVLVDDFERLSSSGAFYCAVKAPIGVPFLHLWGRSACN